MGLWAAAGKRSSLVPGWPAAATPKVLSDAYFRGEAMG